MPESIPLTFKEFYEKYGLAIAGRDNDSYFDLDVYDKAIEGILFKHLRRKQGSVIITTTPKGDKDSYFYNLWEKYKDNIAVEDT